MIEKLVKKTIKNFISYDANQIPYRVKLDANESPFGLPGKVKSKLAEYFLESCDLNLYPDTDSVELRKTLAAYWKTDFKNIVVGTGSDQLIDILIKIFVDKGERVMCPAPSFSMYKLNTLIVGGIPVEFELDKNDCYSYDADRIIEMANEYKPKIIFLCTPNNPTGGIIPEKDILKIVDACKESVVVIDEAYAEFSRETFIPFVAGRENVIVLRTFSKAYGLAGIRCGYSISGKEIADELNKVRPPYNISSLSLLVARLVFEERDLIDRQIDYIIKQREELVLRLENIRGIKVYKSKSNFLLIEVPDADHLSKELTKRGVLIRSFGNVSILKNCLRVTVGNIEQNEVLLKEIKENLINIL